jgi:O-acetyl-ADP-ribose deacetylase (regulator of RNase III)
MILKNNDITNETEGAILHGVNCSGYAYKSGVASAIRKQWPNAYNSYVKRGGGVHLLGTIDIIQVNDDLLVINGYTQETYGYDGQRYASPEATDRVLQKAFVYCYLNNIQLKAPMIGSGLGGLDWETEVKPLFEKYEKIYNIQAEIFYI